MAKLLQTGMKEPVTPMFASFLICRSPARPWICWMVSDQFQYRVRPLPMFPPLGEIGVGPLMEMSWLAKKSSALAPLDAEEVEALDPEHVEQAEPVVGVLEVDVLAP